MELESLGGVNVSAFYPISAMSYSKKSVFSVEKDGAKYPTGGIDADSDHSVGKNLRNIQNIWRMPGQNMTKHESRIAARSAPLTPLDYVSSMDKMRAIDKAAVAGHSV